MSVVADKPQHLEALEQANRIRFYRADVKRAIASLPRSAGLVEAAAKLDDPVLDRMTVSELLLSVNRVGPSAVRAFCYRAGITGGKRIGSLTARQVHVLREVLS